MWRARNGFNPKFKPRPSILSNFDNLHSKTLVGFRNMLYVIGMIFVLSQCIINYYETAGHKLVDSALWLVISQELPIMILMYLMIIATTFSFYGLQQSTAKGLISIERCEFIHYFLLAFAVVSPLLAVCTCKLPPTQSTFILFLMVLMCMKMHSYIMQNQCYHLKHLQQTLAQQDQSRHRHQTRSPPPGEAFPVDSDDDAQPPASSDDSFYSSYHYGSVRYPDNINLHDFFEFLFMPTLVYQLNFPRTPRVRPKVVVKTLALVAGVLSMIVTGLTHFILPILRRSNELPFLYLLSILCIPCSLLYIVIFFFVFELILNGFAEVTRFADRHFYDDWWNSTAYDEFARKWNRPIHEWLLVHIYNRIQSNHSRTSALWITFFFSHFIYDMLMAVSFGVRNPYILILIIFELLFIYALRPFRSSQLGNLLWWCIMFCSTPLATLLYAREYYMSVTYVET